MYTVNIYLVIEGRKVFWKCSKSRVYSNLEESLCEKMRLEEKYKVDKKYIIELKKILFQTVEV